MKKTIDYKAFYLKTRAQIKKCMDRTVERNKKLIILLKDKPCMDCLDTFPSYVMHFDHRDGKKKKYNVSQLLIFNSEKLMMEARKCDVVCANCHAKRTHNRKHSMEK